MKEAGHHLASPTKITKLRAEQGGGENNDKAHLYLILPFQGLE